jgi:hypothetical protein
MLAGRHWLGESGARAERRRRNHQSSCGYSRGNRTHLLDRTACCAIRHIRTREFECPRAVVTITGVELRDDYAS